MSQSSAIPNESNHTSRGQNHAIRQRIDELERQLEAMLAVVAPQGQPGEQASRLPTSASEYAKVRRVIRARRARETFFDSSLFSDPAWDMLLELHVAQIAQKRISISALSKVSGVPTTTGLRWAGTLEEHGLVNRRDDPLDGRRVFIELTEKGQQAMTDFFNDSERADAV